MKRAENPRLMRWLEPDSVKEIWHQVYNQQPWATSLVGRDRTTCRTYVRHFLDHWAGRPSIFEEDLDAWVDNFMKPGNLQGGFNWYVGIDEARTEVWRHGAPKLPKIGVPARFFWGEEDPLVKIEWADRLGEYFSDYSFSAAEGAGHFVHYERPEAANRRDHRVLLRAISETSEAGFVAVTSGGVKRLSTHRREF